MIAVDTNVVVRLLTGDDAKQSARARALFEREDVFLPKTVLLESDWVLRRLYEFPAKSVANALLSIISLPNVQCEDLGAAVAALNWAGKGMDLADALHLASSRNAGRLASFDVKLAKLAAKLTDVPVFAP